MQLAAAKCAPAITHNYNRLQLNSWLANPRIQGSLAKSGDAGVSVPTVASDISQELRQATGANCATQDFA